MTLDRPEAAVAKHIDRIPEGFSQSAAAGSDKAAENKNSVAQSSSHRAAEDRVAVHQGFLPPEPGFFDSSTSNGKSAISSNDAFSKQFDGMKPGEIKNGKDGSLQFNVDSDGTQHRFSDNTTKGTQREEVVHPDKSTELTTNGKGTIETQKWDAGGNLRSDSIDTARTPDGKLNYSDQKSWGATGRLNEDYKRWQTNDGEFHEDHQMNLPDGTKINQKMDGDRTVTRTTNPDGSWDNTVKTMNVDQINPDTGRHYKTMTVDRTSGK